MRLHVKNHGTMGPCKGVYKIICFCLDECDMVERTKNNYEKKLFDKEKDISVCKYA